MERSVPQLPITKACSVRSIWKARVRIGFTGKALVLEEKLNMKNHTDGSGSISMIHSTNVSNLKDSSSKQAGKRKTVMKPRRVS